MKIGVLGAGAIGSMVGGLIKHHNPTFDVTLIVRGAHGQALTDRGAVALVGPWGEHDVPIHAATDVGQLADSNFILITVKSHDTEKAITSAVPYLGDATVISIQNGINHHLLNRYVAPDRLVMGMTATNIAVDEPGIVRLILDGATVVGSLPGVANPTAADSVAKLLNSTGLETSVHSNVVGVQYNKLAINAIGYASCISASNFITEAICHRPWRQAVGLPLLGECFSIFQRADIQLDRIPELTDAHRLQSVLRRMNWPIIGTALAMGAKLIYNKKPIQFSLFEDLKRGRPTEAEFINGHVVQLAAENNITAPYNALAVDLINELEHRGAGQFYSREEVIQRFSMIG